MLCSYFHNHPEVRCLVEPINPPGHRHHMGPNKSDDKLIPRKYVFNNLPMVLDWLFTNGAFPSDVNLTNKSCRLIASFKIMAHQIQVLPNQKLFWNELKRRKVKIIINHRHNIVKQIVSDYITTITKIPVNYGKKPGTARVLYPINQIATKVAEIKADRAYLDKHVSKYGLDHVSIIYESVLEDKSVLERTFEWVCGRKPYFLEPQTIKQNSDNLRDIIINYDEFANECARLHLSAFLKDT